MAQITTEQTGINGPGMDDLDRATGLKLAQTQLKTDSSRKFPKPAMCDIEAGAHHFEGIGTEQLRLGFIRKLGSQWEVGYS